MKVNKFLSKWCLRQNNPIRSCISNLNSRRKQESSVVKTGFKNRSAKSTYILLKEDDQYFFVDTNKVRKDQDVLREVINSEKANTNEILNDDFKLIRIIWNEIGITEHFRFIFESIVNEISPKEKENFMEFELASLERIFEDLKKLSKEIKTREKIITLLRHFEEILIESEINSKLANDILFSFKNLRLLTINIVKLFSNLREFNHYNNFKFDHEKINKKKLYFDRNYLAKVSLYL